MFRGFKDLHVTRFTFKFNVFLKEIFKFGVIWMDTLEIYEWIGWVGDRYFGSEVEEIQEEKAVYSILKHVVKVVQDVNVYKECFSIR